MKRLVCAIEYMGQGYQGWQSQRALEQFNQKWNQL